MLTRRELLTGAAAAGAFAALPEGAEALSRAQRRTLVGGAVSRIPFASPAIFAGDSITGNGFSSSATTSSTTVRNLWTWGLYLSRYPFRLTAHSASGIGGNTSTQLLARYDADVIAYTPGVVGILIGTNDLTTIAASVTISNISNMLSRNAAIGAHTFLIKILPRGSVGTPMSGTMITAWEAVNAWIATQGSSRVTVIDCESVIGNMDANHTIVTAMANDDLHLSQLGAYACGKVIAAAMHARASSGDSLFTTNSDPANFCSNGFFTGTGGSVSNATGQVADSWIMNGSTAGGATVVCSKVARSDGFGSWQQMKLSGTYTGSGKLSRLTRAINVTGLLSIGDVVQIAGEVEMDSSVAALATHIQVGTWPSTDFMYANNYYLSQVANAEAWTAVLCSVPFTLSATPTNLSLQLGVYLANTAGTDAVDVTARFGRFEIRKL